MQDAKIEKRIYAEIEINLFVVEKRYGGSAAFEDPISEEGQDTLQQNCPCVDLVQAARPPGGSQL